MEGMLNRLLSRFGTPFYAKEQGYRASYLTEVKNISREHQRGFLIIPVVPTTATQTLLAEPVFSPEVEIKTEHTYGNRYLVWQFAIDPGQTQTFKQFFQITVKPNQGIQPAASDERAAFLKPNEYVQSDSQEIIELAQQIKGKEQNPKKIINKINEFVIGHLAYGNPISGLYKATDVLRSLDKLGTTGVPVDCGGFDTLFVALAQACGIPARIVSGFWAGYHKNDMHAWVEILLPDGSWLPADPSMEHLARHKRTRKSGKLGFAGSDRIALSYGSDIELEVGGDMVTTDILQNPIIYPENPNIEVLRIFSTQPL